MLFGEYSLTENFRLPLIVSVPKMVEILVSGVESRFAGTEASNLCLSET